uniref:HOXD12 n=1 Tax=Gekko ulikovskii TaxID=742354 RepID=D3XE22_9SAUR|nr:HOXD12 [Gekko ulikovskii]
MCDRSLCRPGYVGSLLNLPATAADSFYFPGLRATGSHQLAASLPALSYPRSSIAWTPPASHPFAAAATATAASSSSSSSPPPPYLPAALHPVGSGSKEAPEGPPRFYPHDGASRQERRRPSREDEMPLGQAKGPKYEPGPTGALQEADPGAAGSKEDLHGHRQHQTVNLNVTLLPPAATQLSPRAALQDGLPWSPTQGRPSRKKRRPYSKQQIAALESEFVRHEFINRQKRKELSHRLHLSDQQVKIWFQNRRMKKKRAVIREQALALY